MADLHGYIDEHLDRFREELFEFLRIPSVSARSEHRSDVRKGAEWLAERLDEVGMEASIEATEGHPIVIGEWRGAGDDAPTVLVYGHYDVQPPDPLELWETPPFEPTVRDGRIFARGSTDDKGQLYVHVKALEAHLRVNDSLPVNVIVLAEGEEEVGSENLMPFVKANADRLAADYIVVSDTTMVAPGVPTIGVSLRGIAYFQIDVTGPAQDLHSGSYGGAVMNPATALARIIGSFHLENGHVAIPGFYDDVDIAEAYRERIAEVPFDEETFREETGASELAGEEGFSTLERLWVRPTVEVNGLLSGYTGEGPKTVLPARAMAKVSCRLVPDQDPADIARIVEEHVRRVAPEGVRIEFRTLQTGRAWRAKIGGPLDEAGARALERAFGREPVHAGEGGSIPIVEEFEWILDAPVLLMGLGLPGQNTHAPNEWFSLENFEKGAHASAALLEELMTD